MASREYFLDSKYADIRKAYKTYIKEIATFLNGSDVEQDVEDLVEFETFFANVSM